MDEMISEKKDREDGSSSCSNSGTMLAETLPHSSHPLTLSVLIAQGTFPHVCELYCSLGARIHEPITALGVELCSSDDLR